MLPDFVKQILESFDPVRELQLKGSRSASAKEIPGRDGVSSSGIPVCEPFGII